MILGREVSFQDDFGEFFWFVDNETSIGVGYPGNNVLEIVFLCIFQESMEDEWKAGRMRVANHGNFDNERVYSQVAEYLLFRKNFL